MTSREIKRNCCCKDLLLDVTFFVNFFAVLPSREHEGIAKQTLCHFGQKSKVDDFRVRNEGISGLKTSSLMNISTYLSIYIYINCCLVCFFVFFSRQLSNADDGMRVVVGCFGSLVFVRTALTRQLVHTKWIIYVVRICTDGMPVRRW